MHEVKCAMAAMEHKPPPALSTPLSDSSIYSSEEEEVDEDTKKDKIMIALNRFKVNYNASQNEQTIVSGLGGYHNIQPLSSAGQNKETRKIEKLERVIIHRKKPDSHALVAKGRKDKMLVRIEEDIEKLSVNKNSSSKYAYLKQSSRNFTGLKATTELKADEGSERGNSRLIRSVSDARLAVNRIIG